MQHIILAFTKEESAEKIKRMLALGGYDVYSSCRTKAELMRTVAGLDEILVITGFKLPDATCDEIFEDVDGEIIAIIKPEQSEYIHNRDIFTIPLPTNAARLSEAVAILSRRIQPTAKNTRSSEDRKLIETAKLYLMEKYMMDEPAAYRFIQKQSMNRGYTLTKTAEIILKK